VAPLLLAARIAMRQLHKEVSGSSQDGRVCGMAFGSVGVDSELAVGNVEGGEQALGTRCLINGPKRMERVLEHPRI
jgi:hypothetical protein